MRIAFCSTPVSVQYAQVQPNQWPPLWVMSLGALISQSLKNATVAYIDGTRDSVDTLIKRVLAFSPDLLCFSPVLISYKNDLAVAAAVKGATHCRVVMGGHHATNLHEHILRYRNTIVDVVVLYDGEPAILDLCNNTVSLSNVPNIAYWADGAVHRNSVKDVSLGTLPAPWVDEATRQEYISGTRYVYSQKGCLVRVNGGRCVFCSRIDSGMRFRQPQQVLDDMVLYTKAATHTPSIFDVSDDFLSSPPWVEELAGLVTRAETSLPPITVFAASQRVTKASVHNLLHIGVKDLILGFESADPLVLDNVGKGQASLEQNANAAKILTDHGIAAVGSYVLGLPGESEKSIELCLEQIRSLRAQCGGGFSGYANVLIPFPGSPVFTRYCRGVDLRPENDQLDQQQLQIEYLRSAFHLSPEQAESRLCALEEIRDDINSRTHRMMIRSVGLSANRRSSERGARAPSECVGPTKAHTFHRDIVD